MSRVLCSVIGGSSCSREEYATAREVGRRLAEAGFTVLSGGLGGVMEAASRGAREANGLVIGILPGTDAEDANPWVDVALPTGLGDARNALVASAGDVVIAVGGSLGTLSEICLTLKRGTTVIGLGTWTLDPTRVVPGIDVRHAEDPEEAVAMARTAVEERGRESSRPLKNSTGQGADANS